MSLECSLVVQTYGASSQIVHPGHIPLIWEHFGPLQIKVARAYRQAVLEQFDNRAIGREPDGPGKGSQSFWVVDVTYQ
jgi:citrate lyase beta subunit